MTGIILCVCAVVVPVTASGASARGVTHTKVGPAQAATTKAVHSRGRHGALTATTGTPTLSADPSTGLLDGQPIAVTGNGFTAKAEYDLVECPSGDTDALDCDAGTVEPAKADATGSFSSTYTAVRTIVGFESGTDTDCAAAAGCALTAFDSNLTAVAETPISFADVAIVPATLTADPSTGLLDGQKITVSGTEFAANSPVLLIECQSAADTVDCSGSLAEVTADSSGSFSTSYPVTRIIEGLDGPVDCAQGSGCVITASNGDGTAQASAPIMFADVAIIPPVMTASPSTNLNDGQTVAVTGKGFRAGEELGLSECAAGSTDGSECVLEDGLGNVGEVKANRAGRISTTFNVARVITLIGGTIDCSEAPGCVIGAVDLEDPTGTVISMVPISFNPKGKPLPPLNLEVHVDPTGTIGVGSGRQGNTAEISGTISCDRTTPVPVEFQMQVTEPVAAGQAGGDIEGLASCSHSGAKFSVSVSAGRKSLAGQFVPGPVGVLFAAYADSGSSSQSTTTNASVTLKAPKS